MTALLWIALVLLGLLFVVVAAFVVGFIVVVLGKEGDE